MKSNKNLINAMMGTALGSIAGFALMVGIPDKSRIEIRDKPYVKQEMKNQRTNYVPNFQPVQLPVYQATTNQPVQTTAVNTNFNVRTMNLSQEGLRFIAQHERLRTNRYSDVAGIPTIGYGHVIRVGENYTNITPAQAEFLLSNDVQTAVNAVRRTITNNLTQNQFDALVSFTFNIGNNAFRNSTLARMINSGDTNASAQFDRWNRAGGRVVQGLVNRRRDERDLYERAIYR